MTMYNEKSKLTALAEVVVFTLALFGFLMLIALFKGLLVNESGIRWAGIYQVMVYLGIMDLGIIICLTDIVFQRVGTSIRLVVFLGTLYAASLLFFTGAAINPLGSILNFTVYTVFFGMVAIIVLLFWYIYQTVVSKQYSKALVDYQAHSGK